MHISLSLASLFILFTFSQQSRSFSALVLCKHFQSLLQYTLSKRTEVIYLELLSLGRMHLKRT